MIVSKGRVKVQKNVAIDGPAGAGKSTAAKMLAEKLGYTYIDTGAMYRAFTWKVLDNNHSFEDIEKLIDLAKETEINFDKNTGRIYCDGKDVTDFIRTPLVSEKVSIIAEIPEIRRWLQELQREMAKNKKAVMDGRDIGTYVIPDAAFKFFLTASLEERTKRRYNELKEKGYKTNFEDVTTDMLNRDKKDQKRLYSPLSVADDAVIIDTSSLVPEEVVEEILKYLRV